MLIWTKVKSSDGNYNLVCNIKINNESGRLEIKYEHPFFKLYFNGVLQTESFDTRILAQQYVENILNKDEK